MKETEKQAKNISLINEALRFRTHRTFCISGIFILVFVIVIAAIVGGLIEKNIHIRKVSTDLEKALKQSRIQGEELRDLKDNIQIALQTVILNQDKFDSIANEVSNIYTKVDSLTSNSNSHTIKLDSLTGTVNTVNTYTRAIYSKVVNIERTMNNL